MLFSVDNEDRSIYLIEPRSVTVEHFQPYYLDKKRELRFKPSLYLRFPGGEQVAIEGYDEVWRYLDALFPDNKLPRAILNDAMKNEDAIEQGLPYEKWPSMVADMAAFHLEAASGWLTLRVNDERPSRGVLGGLTGSYRRGVIAFDSLTIHDKRRFKDAPDTCWLPRLGDAINSVCVSMGTGRFAQLLMLPYTDSRGSMDKLSLVIREWTADGAFNGATIIQSLGDGKAWITGLVNTRYGVVRPIRGRMFNTTPFSTALQLSNEYGEGVSDMDAEYDITRSPPCWDLAGIFSTEQDDLQHDFVTRLFLRRFG